MHALPSSIVDGVRLVAWRAPRERTEFAGPGIFFALATLYLAAGAALAAWTFGAPLQLDSFGIANSLAEILLVLAISCALVRMAQRDIAWHAASMLLAAATIGMLLVRGPLTVFANALDARGHSFVGTLVDLLPLPWWLLMLVVFAHWLAPQHSARMAWSALLAFGLFAFAWICLPSNLPLASAHVAVTTNGMPEAPDGSTAGGQASDESEALAFDAEKLMYDQSARLDAALANLQPQTPGRVDLYVLAFAGDAQEDVFRNEAEYVARLFPQRFGAAGRTLVLENNLASINTRPLATWTNLRRALDAIAKTMDPAEDILLLYLTSHGSEDHQLLVDLDPLPLNQIEPIDLADALKTSPRLRWKVIVVNACYSGGFIDALRDDSTMVMTSARADRTSFGCGVDSDITYFGKAFLADALNHTTSFRDAFERARRSIAEWETDDGEEHSEPQLATSAAIEAKLSAWQRGLAPGPAVPFAPAAAQR